MKLRFAIAVLLCAWWAPAAFGQGCVMCSTSAQGAGVKGQKALSRAVTVLLVPPVGLMTLMVGMGFRYGRKRDQERDAQISTSAPL